MGQMLKQIWRSLVRWFQRLFGSDNRRKPTPSSFQPETPKPLSDTDYEFLYTQLLEGVTHGWQQPRVLRFFESLGDRGSQAEWVGWLRRFGDRLLASPVPNNELAARMVQLGQMGCGEISDVSYEIGMQLLTRSPTRTGQREPVSEPVSEIFEYEEYERTEEVPPENNQQEENPELKTVTLDELFVMLEQDAGLRQQVAEQLQIDTTDPQVIIQALVNQFNAADQENADQPAEEASQQASDEAEAWLNQGVQQVLAEKFPEAIASFERATQLKPDNEEAWYSKGIALSHLGRFEEAIASLDKALQLKHNYPEAWNLRGFALQNLNRYEEAIASLDQALQFKLDDWQSWIGRGNCAANSVSYDPLLASLSQLAQNNPNLNQRGFEGQIACYQEGLKYITPDSDPVGWGILHQAIGNAHHQKGQRDFMIDPYFHQALAEYQEALKTLTEENFPDAYQAILQDIQQVQLALGETNDDISSPG